MMDVFDITSSFKDLDMSFFDDPRIFINVAPQTLVSEIFYIGWAGVYKGIEYGSYFLLPHDTLLRDFIAHNEYRTIIKKNILETIEKLKQEDGK